MNFLAAVNANIIGKKVNKPSAIEKRTRYTPEVSANQPIVTANVKKPFRTPAPAIAPKNGVKIEEIISIKRLKIFPPLSFSILSESLPSPLLAIKSL